METSIDTSQLETALKLSLGSLTLGRVLYTLILLAVCLLVTRLVNSLAKRLLARGDLEERVRKYILGAVRAVLYVLTVLIVADSLGIPVTSLIALFSVFGLAISLAAQDVLSNVAGGLVILFSRPFTLGDYVATDDGEGTVSEISLTHTKLDTYDGLRVMLPNSKLVDGKIINYTTRGIRRVDHGVSASYDDGTEAVRAACLRAVERTAGVLPDPAPQVVLSAYGESAITYRVRFWAKTEDYWDAYNSSLEEIRRCFAEDGLTMTYNHLNVHIVDTALAEKPRRVSPSADGENK